MGSEVTLGEALQDAGRRGRSCSGVSSAEAPCEDMSALSRSFVLEGLDGEPCQDTAFGGELGGKTIGAFGSFCLITNNITGPGMLHIPAIFQQAGLIVPLIVFFGVCTVSAGAATLLCDSMARMPQNGAFKFRYEFSDVMTYFLGRRAYIFSQIAFFLGIFTQCAASILGTAQSMDCLVVLLFGKTWAIQTSGARGEWLIDWSPERYCRGKMSSTACIPFANITGDATHDVGMVLTVGYVLTLVSLMPLGFLNLDDNIKFQIVSFFVLTFLCVEFLCEMVFVQGQDASLLPMMGTSYSSMLGTIIFNFAYSPTLPSWINEKKPKVRTSATLWSSALFSTAMYVLMGVAGAMAYPHAETNLLQVLGARRTSLLTRVCSYIFGTLVIGLGIPVFCIVMRYNLVVGGCPKSASTFFGVVFPWLVSWMLYQGSAAQTFISLSGVVLISAIGFVLPLIAAIAASQLTPPRRCAIWKTLCNTSSGLSETVVRPLPARWLSQQRRYASILLCLTIPAVTMGLVDQLATI
eukprot:TRINITY_DN24266_c0_g2_i1.p1 TRINITY_DN24266_c0_g2~~TRINITY_DN24266_c0_g2_i1.p1  ORF type:complete len:522 (-),score=50.34 TRINITY_DN24266_c0_g2_i1:218-1783(-)